eukprot:2286568-Amphidinium_carterae.1
MGAFSAFLAHLCEHSSLHHDHCRKRYLQLPSNSPQVTDDAMHTPTKSSCANTQKQSQRAHYAACLYPDVARLIE